MKELSGPAWAPSSPELRGLRHRGWRTGCNPRRTCTACGGGQGSPAAGGGFWGGPRPRSRPPMGSGGEGRQRSERSTQKCNQSGLPGSLKKNSSSFLCAKTEKRRRAPAGQRQAAGGNLENAKFCKKTNEKCRSGKTPDKMGFGTWHMQLCMFTSHASARGRVEICVTNLNIPPPPPPRKTPKKTWKQSQSLGGNASQR